MNDRFYILKQIPKFLGPLPENCICGICDKVLIDAVSPTCGCVFCRECVKSNLINGNENCPGGRDACKTVNLEHTDPSHFINSMIEDLQIACINEGCAHEASISETRKHLYLCTYRLGDCPYQIFGCSKKNVTKLEIDNHSQQDVVIHNAMLVKWLNSNTQTREDAADLRQQNERLKEQVDSICARLSSVEKEVADSRQESRRLRTDLEKKITEEADQRQRGVESLSSTLESSFQETIRSLREDFEKCRYVGEILWKIDNLSQKRTDSEKTLWSPSFFTHNLGYKMCMLAYPNGNGDGKGTFLSIYLSIMKGPNDDFLAWPCIEKFQLSLLSNEANTGHKQLLDFETVSANLQPSTERNREVGFTQFVSWDYLPSYLKNDTIIVKCEVQK